MALFWLGCCLTTLVICISILSSDNSLPSCNSMNLKCKYLIYLHVFHVLGNVPFFPSSISCIIYTDESESMLSISQHISLIGRATKL